MPIQSEPLTEVMATYCHRPDRILCALSCSIFSFIPDTTRILAMEHSDVLGKAFARDVMRNFNIKDFIK